MGNSQQEKRPPDPKRENLWVLNSEMKTTTEVLKDWLPWRKKKRKRE